ncbi:hypothetical protein Purlil1_13989 [Purpureocillium lilacinum]|uniref:Uncharacterized protein n=1 Tax=Purpureocillium lilacinum TaxID=33203 RepID=A0ABR0BCU1_PURLI|nr:hypothetical protein Purlil1_13989 [Purpureocillium lilacinum]
MPRGNFRSWGALAILLPPSIYAATAVGSSSAAATANMAIEVKMTRVERQADAALLAYFSEFGDCGISWAEPTKAQKIEPPANTVGIVVDVPHNKGAIRIYNSTENDAHIGTVGTEDAGFMVIMFPPSTLGQQSVWNQR